MTLIDGFRSHHGTLTDEELSELLKAGTDVAVVGFDNILFSSLPSVDLTTITPSNTELGNTAMQIICESYEIRDKKQINTLLEPHIIYRSTYRADEAIPEI